MNSRALLVVLSLVASSAGATVIDGVATHLARDPDSGVIWRDVSTISTCWGLAYLRDPAVVLGAGGTWRVAFTDWYDGGLGVYVGQP